MDIKIAAKVLPPLDPQFVAPSLWNARFRQLAEETGHAEDLAIALERPNGSISVFTTRVFPHEGAYIAVNERYVERLLTTLLWIRGGYRLTIGGPSGIADFVRGCYRTGGQRSFDFEFLGERIYGHPIEVIGVPFAEAPSAKESSSSLGRHLDGCRIGFDLGGSDRKCSAVIDGQVVHTEEVVWDPYFQADPAYHYAGIQDTLKRAAAKLPRVDAIGGSAAGVYVDNEVRMASLFRGVPRDVFDAKVKGMFFDLQKEWGGVPFVVVNDGEVTALAASMSLETNGILGISLGTSTAGGFVTPSGTITDWLNELAFVPVDYRKDAPCDEWSGDGGVGAQYFSQQAVARLAPVAGIPFDKDVPLPERLSSIQALHNAGDPRPRKIFETIGVYLGYAVANYAQYYDLQHALILGRVTSGEGGDLIVNEAQRVLNLEYPALAEQIALHLPDEKSKRHGQAVAAASLPALR